MGGAACTSHPSAHAFVFDTALIYPRLDVNTEPQLRSGAALNAAPSPSLSPLSGVSLIGTGGPLFFFNTPSPYRVISFRLQLQCWLSLERRGKERRERFPIIFLPLQYSLFALLPFPWRCCIAAAAPAIGLDPILINTTKEKREEEKRIFSPLQRQHLFRSFDEIFY